MQSLTQSSSCTSIPHSVPGCFGMFVARGWGRERGAGGSSGHGRGGAAASRRLLTAAALGGTTSAPALLPHFILSSQGSSYICQKTRTVMVPAPNGLHTPGSSCDEILLIYISSAAHKSLHSGSNGLSFSCYYSLKHVLN